MIRLPTPPDKYDPRDQADVRRTLEQEAARTRLDITKLESGGAGGADTNVQFNDGGSSLGGVAAFIFDKVLAKLGLTGFVELLKPGSTPGVTSARDRLRVWASQWITGGRPDLFVRGTGIPWAVERSRLGGFHRVEHLLGKTSTPNNVGLDMTPSGGTFVDKFDEIGGRYTTMTTPSTNSSVAGAISGTPVALLGTGTSKRYGGFHWYARMGLDATLTTMRLWIGLGKFNILGSYTSDLLPSPGASLLLFRYDSQASDASWKLLSCSTGVATVTDTGVQINANTMYEFYLYAEPGGGSVYWRVVNLNTGAEASGTVAPPVQTDPLYQVYHLTNRAAAGRTLWIGPMVCEMGRVP